MLIDANRYAFHSRRKRGKKRLLLLLALLAAAAALAVFFTVLLPRIRNRSSSAASKELDLYTMWDSGLYQQISLKCKEGLQERPLDSELLMFYGIAQYYRAYYEKALENKLPLLDESIGALRKALLSSEIDYRGEIYYVLGQAYYHKGQFFYDLTIKYIEKSLEAGYHGDNAYEYIAIAYGGLGDSEKELSSFLKAYDVNQSDFILLSIGKAYLKLSDFEAAKDFLLRCLNKTSDPDVEKECRFNLADIYKQSGDYLKAEVQLEAIVEMDSGSAKAHFQLGELYDRMNSIVRAVAEWKKTLAIDPTHYGAKRRLYK